MVSKLTSRRDATNIKNHSWAETARISLSSMARCGELCPLSRSPSVVAGAPASSPLRQASDIPAAKADQSVAACWDADCSCPDEHLSVMSFVPVTTEGSACVFAIEMNNLYQSLKATCWFLYTLRWKKCFQKFLGFLYFFFSLPVVSEIHSQICVNFNSGDLSLF